MLRSPSLVTTNSVITIKEHELTKCICWFPYHICVHLIYLVIISLKNNCHYSDFYTNSTTIIIIIIQICVRPHCLLWSRATFFCQFQFFHYFLLSSVVLLCTTRSMPHKLYCISAAVILFS